jgi:hypothetical protein
MKKRFLIQFLVAIFVIGFAGSLYATPTVYLKEVNVSPAATGTFIFPNYGSGDVYYGQYNLQIDWDKSGPGNYEPISGFCVEDVDSPPANNQIYELIAPTGKYLDAAYILSQYEAGNITAQAAQIAVWEVVMDTDNNVYTGDFHATFSNAYTIDAQSFLTSMNIGGFTGSGYYIARNPVGVDPPARYQDYVIHVPDASIMYLLGTALLCLGMLGRRKSKSV